MNKLLKVRTVCWVEKNIKMCFFPVCTQWGFLGLSLLFLATWVYLSRQMEFFARVWRTVHLHVCLGNVTHRRSMERGVPFKKTNLKGDWTNILSHSVRVNQINKSNDVVQTRHQKSLSLRSVYTCLHLSGWKQPCRRRADERRTRNSWPCRCLSAASPVCIGPVVVGVVVGLALRLLLLWHVKVVSDWQGRTCKSDASISFFLIRKTVICLTTKLF